MFLYAISCTALQNALHFDSKENVYNVCKMKNHTYYLSATIYCDYLFSIIHSRVYIPQDMYVYMCKEKRIHHILQYIANIQKKYKKVVYKQTVSGYV